MARQSQIFYKRMAELMAEKRGEKKGFFTAWLRCKLSFLLVKSTLLCLRGTRSSRTHRDDLGNTDFENVVRKSRLDVDLAKVLGNAPPNCYVKVKNKLRKKK